VLNVTDPLIGQKLGDYTIQTLLGRGGMARVYKGYDAQLERYAAVKVIDTHLIASADASEYRERFQREAKAIAKLRHPNIVNVYQFGVEANLYYMAMVFVEGTDLSFVLRSHAQAKTRMSYGAVLRLSRDIALALDYAHRLGVIHRDIKPSNIMVTENGHGILTDFGLALSVPEGSAGNTFGSAHYIAPEQAKSSNLAVPQSDLYSLCVVIYQMLAGKVPFDDPSAMAVAIKHLQNPPPPPSAFNPELKGAVEAVLLKGLQKDPQERFVSGKELVVALEKAMRAANLNLNYSAASLPMFPTQGSRPQAKASGDSSTILLGSQAKAQELADRSAHNQPSPPTPSFVRAPTLPTAPSKMRLPHPFGESRRKFPLLPVVGGIAVVLLFALVLFLGNPDDASTQDGTPATVPAVIAVVTEEATAAPTATPTDVPTATMMPTDVPTVTMTPTDVPTVVPTRVRPTSTRVLPSSSPTIVAMQPTIEATTSDLQVRLVYNDTRLMLINVSDTDLDLGNIVFTQATDDGLRLVYPARLWTAQGGFSIQRLEPDACLLVTTPDDREERSTDGCDPAAWFTVSAYSRWFWISDAEHASFEVQLFGQPFVRCAIAAGECEFSLPN
jgi:serine/threonine protein kinase